MRDRVWVLGIASAVLLVDQVTKAIVDARIPIHESVPVIDGVLSLTHVRNTGAAFGILSNAPAGPVRIGLVIVSIFTVALIWAYAREGWHDRSVVAAFGLVLGGALGNLLDRLRLHEVVDFVDVYWGQYHWPSFNVADMAITLGALTLFVGMARHGQSEESLAERSPGNSNGRRPGHESSAEKRPAEDVAGLS
jgi:signal peptidase II